LVLAPLLLLAALGVRGLMLSKRAVLEGARAACERNVADLIERFAGASRELADECGAPILYPEAPPPAPANEAQELFRSAFDLSRDEAAQRWSVLENEHRDAVAESGVPLLPLVAWRQLQDASTPAESRLFADKLARAAVEMHPSALTPELLAQAARLLVERGADTKPLSRWQTRWQHEEEARAVLRANAARIATERRPLWLEGGGQHWWLEGDAEGAPRLIVPESSLVALAQRIAAASPWPQYAAASIALGGRELIEPPPNGSLLASTAQGSIAVSALLADPAGLYAQQRVQALWLGTLLACALAAALAGFWLMRRALDRERQLGELKSNFVASVSHELRAPVASMRVMAENLETGVVHEATRRGEYHRLISEECRRLSTLIDNVLDFARIEQNRKTYRFAETDVVTLAREAIELMQPRAAQRGQEISAELEPLDPPPFCDGLAVQQALINLLDNASKFSPEGAAIAVRLRSREEATWELSVADSGPGIPRVEHGKIFERFYRLGSELRRETQGAGIGLSIVQHIVEAHGGRIEVESEPGAGAKFTLIFPHLPPGANGAD
jgi:two-component system phosphate regulon sensor histidine kinase PhoR